MRLLAGELMSSTSLCEPPAASQLTGSYLASVVSVKDPDNLGRIQIRLLSCEGGAQQDASIWARVAVPFAGAGRGAFLLPGVGDEVVVSFLQGDSRLPIVVGGLWNGSARPPEKLGGKGERVDRWTLVGKAGTRIAIVEESDGQATISLTTPGGTSLTLKQTGGGQMEVKAGGSTISMDGSGIKVRTKGKIEVDADRIDVKAGRVNVKAAMSKFSGTVKCETLIASTVVAGTYTVGAGNVW
jgi:uncharacterized protein involved in type VI secretion and phage assembly